MARTALATSKGEPLPLYADRYRAVARHDPAVTDTTELRALLTDRLNVAGFPVTTSRTLREACQAWEHNRGFVSVEHFA
ncbi:hypothetical protein HZA43_06010 [Candidatus Peregrinibacteria bacterium]|nr:hypothetical protein [Candidatus Peregrinibacteria bacterium]